MLTKTPGPSIFAVLVMTIGISLVATVYSIVNGVMFAPLPFEKADEILEFRFDPLAENLYESLRTHEFYDFQEQTTTLESVEAMTFGGVNVETPDGTFNYDSSDLTAGFLNPLKVQPLMGRSFLPEEAVEGANPVFLLGYKAWQRDFHGDPDIIGKSFLINRKPATVIGIMPKGFEFPISQDIWRPLIPDVLKEKRGEGRMVTAYGRLRENTTVEEVKAELETIAARLIEAYPEVYQGQDRIQVNPIQDMFLGGGTKPILTLMLVATFLVLFIACANVANLLLAKSVLRTRELAIRSALGASRRRIIKQMLTESVVITLIGALFGTILAYFTTSWLWDYSKENIDVYFMNFDLDGNVLMITLMVTLLSAVLSGLVPAWRASKTDINEILKESTRGGGNLKIGKFAKFLVILQIAMSCILLSVALYQTVIVRQSLIVSLPYDTSTMLTARIQLDDVHYEEDESKKQFREQLLEKLQSTPGVEAAGMTTATGMVINWYSKIMIEGKEYRDKTEYDRGHNEIVSPDYFESLGIPIIMGRNFEATDIKDSTEVAIVNTLFAERHWPGENPIGKRFRDTWKEELKWQTVIGVVEDLNMETSALFNPDSDGSGFYRSLDQFPQSSFTVFVSSRGDPTALTHILRETVKEVDSGVPVLEIRTVDGWMNRFTWGLQFIANIFRALGIVAVFMAAIGLYGVMSFSVNQRRREIGIRMALGAKPGKIIRMIIRQGSWQIIIGGVLGLAGSIYASVFLGGLFEGSNLGYELTLYVLLVLLTVAFMALIFPARKAAEVTPMEALREE